MDRIFMIDCEATGADPKNDSILQIGILEATLVDGYWKPGRTYERKLFTHKRPTSQFAKEHLVELYDKCNMMAFVPYPQIRLKVLEFFKECGATPPNVFVVGWNASNFDIPLLEEHGILERSHYKTIDGKDIHVGDTHYRIYEMGGSISIVMNAYHITDRKVVIDAAFRAYPEIPLPEGKQHDALYDCYRQLRILNGLIRIIRVGGNFDVLP